MDEEFLKATSIPLHSPDAYLLDNSNAHLVFDPGPILKGIPIFCTAYTVEKLSLWIEVDKNRALPLRLPFLPKARTAGTLYLMSPDQLIGLDKQKQNTVLYERKLTQVMVHGDCEVLSKPVWMHHAKPDVWGEQALFNLEYYRKNDGDLQLAHRVQHERRELHNHFAFNGVKVEDAELPWLPQSSDRLAKYCGMKNAQDASRVRLNKYAGPLRRLLPTNWVSVPPRDTVIPLKLPG